MTIATPLLILVLLALSGFADSLGFFYASKIWQHGLFSWIDLARSAAGWAVGISLYIIALKPMSSVGVTSAGNADHGVVCHDHHRRRPLQRALLYLAVARSVGCGAGRRSSRMAPREDGWLKRARYSRGDSK